MQSVEVPPDATRFTSKGVVYFLYMGAAEMRQLQIEWALTRLPTDTKEEWRAKFTTFQDRVAGEDWADKVAVLRVCLGRWAAAAGNGSGPVVLDDAAVTEIVNHAELPSMTPKLGPAYRINGLWQRFSLDMLGVPEDEEEAEPSGPKAKKRPRRASAQSGSSPRA